jgi:hypothetical protein
MNIDKDSIYALIAQRPKIRTVEIADIIDCEPELIQPALALEIASHDIIVHAVTAPNGRPANGFEFSAAFMLTAAYRDIATRAGVIVQGTAETQPVAMEPPARRKGLKTSAGVQWRIPQTAKAAPPPGRPTYSDRAIAFIRANGGRVNNEVLRTALKLGPGASPSSYLRIAMVDGRLVRDGRDWVLGANVDVPPRYKPGVTKARALTPPEPVAAPIAAPAPSPLRCAIWSDGVLELQRDGQTILCLTPGERAVLDQFLLVGAS